MSESILSLQGITKSFGGTPVLNGIDLEAAQGEFITLLGSSGCGKTTTLRIIAGLEDPDQGRVLLEGQDMTHTEPNKRDVNTVFQNYALFPHMSVEQNIGYALKIRKRPKAEIREEVKKMLELVQLEGYQRRKPAELSGGQKQRVAIARSLINRPKILLLDEPLGALDLQLRRQMQQELKRLQKKLGITFIYITHDQEEALNMSDRIAVMREGRFEQIGTPAQVYDSPKTAYVARFVGEANIVKGQAGALRGEQVEFAAPGGSAGFLRRGYSFAPGQEVTLAIRGEQAQAVKGAEGPGLAGVVKEKSFAGGMLRIAVELAGGGDEDLTLVLADGLGSGVKANILSTLTSKILCTMISGGIPLEECVSTIASTLPVCSVRKVAYSTFTIIRILDNKTAHIIQFDNPATIVLRKGELFDYPRVTRVISGKTIWESTQRLPSPTLSQTVGKKVVHIQKFAEKSGRLT